MTTQISEVPRSRLTRRQRARLGRGIQYGIGVLVIALLAAKTDWATFSEAFLRSDIFWRMMPRVITVGMVNTLIYTALAFVFAFFLCLLLAVMKLS